MSDATNKADAATTLAHKRLSVLDLAQQPGNVAEACRQSGVHRTSFYEYKRRFQTHGLDGLKDLPPIPKPHPQTTAPPALSSLSRLSSAGRR